MLVIEKYTKNSCDTDKFRSIIRTDWQRSVIALLVILREAYVVIASHGEAANGTRFVFRESAPQGTLGKQMRQLEQY